MLIMGMQWAFTLVALVLGLVGLRIGSLRSGGEALYALGWRLAGVAFSMYALCMTVQHAWGTWAMVAGTESWVMVRYLEWAPAFNHSRTFLLVAFFGVLGWFMLRRDPPSRGVWSVGVAIVVAGLIGGAWLGLVEGSLVTSTHYTRVALWDAAELLVVLTTLFIGLVTNRMDRHLWALLTTFAVVVALNILYYAAISLVNDSRVWSPRLWVMGSYRLVLILAMLGIALRRLQLARRGVSVGGLLQGSIRPAPATMR
jgi:hypothetical protein